MKATVLVVYAFAVLFNSVQGVPSHQEMDKCMDKCCNQAKLDREKCSSVMHEPEKDAEACLSLCFYEAIGTVDGECNLTLKFKESLRGQMKAYFDDCFSKPPKSKACETCAERIGCIRNKLRGGSLF